jgi:hypothetical protein
VSPFETELLRAGRRDALPARSRQRILTGLGIGGGIIAASTIVSGVKATTAKGFMSTLGVGASVGAIGALAVWAGVTVLAPNPEPPPAAKVTVSKPVARNVTAPAPVTESTAVEELPLAPREPEPKSVTKPAQRGSATPADSLALELAVIEEARNALGRRDYATALRQLDEYNRRFSKRHLNSEAMVLRIETLAAKGDRDAAVRLGKSFLAGQPNGPYARRVRSLVGDP